jgi:hypothetical protein
MSGSHSLWLAAVCIAMAPMSAVAQSPCVNPDSAQSLICINSVQASFALGGNGEETKITLFVHFFYTSPGATVPDFFQVRFSQTSSGGGTWGGTADYKGFTLVGQDKIEKGKGTNGIEANWKSTQPYAPGVEGPPYLIQVQECKNGGPFSHSNCNSWANVTYTPPPPQYIAPPTGHAAPGSSPGSSDKHANPRPAPPAAPNLAESKRPCIQGYVWRQAVAMDYVCVTPQTREQAAVDNKMMNQRIAPNGMCIQGYVWRQTVPLDHVCVTPQTRAQAQQDNAAMNQRVVH